MFTLSIQVALSLVVLFAVRRGNLIYLVYAILLHTLVDFVAVALINVPNRVLWTELIVFFMALIGFIFILRIWKQYESRGRKSRQSSTKTQTNKIGNLPMSREGLNRLLWSVPRYTLQQPV